MLEDQYEVAIKRNTYGDTSIISHSRVLLSDRARLAGHILERWAMVAAQPDGEDAAVGKRSSPWNRLRWRGGLVISQMQHIKNSRTVSGLRLSRQQKASFQK